MMIDEMVISAGVPSASATGDPHLQNIHGQKFDLMKEGEHVLINIPRGTSAGDALLRVQAESRRMGGSCADIYFQKVNVTGSWALAQQSAGYQYAASSAAKQTPEWLTFGKVQLKVVQGHTQSGIAYLNVYVKHLGQAGSLVGGLLGEDDHSDEATPPRACVRRTSLSLQSGTPRDLPSMGVATLA